MTEKIDENKIKQHLFKLRLDMVVEEMFPPRLKQILLSSTSDKAYYHVGKST